MKQNNITLLREMFLNESSSLGEVSLGNNEYEDIIEEEFDDEQV